MKLLSFKRHRFPAEVIRHAVWLYFRFSFSFSLRDVEELLAPRGIDVSYETIRCWTIKFGPADRPTAEAQKAGAVAALASRRDGLFDR